MSVVPLPRTGEHLGARRVDHEALTEGIERPNEAQGVLPAPGSSRPEDGCVDGDRRSRRHRSEAFRAGRSRYSPSGTTSSARKPKNGIRAIEDWSWMYGTIEHRGKKSQNPSQKVAAMLSLAMSRSNPRRGRGGSPQCSPVRSEGTGSRFEARRASCATARCPARVLRPGLRAGPGVRPLLPDGPPGTWYSRANGQVLRRRQRPKRLGSLGLTARSRAAAV